MLMPLRKKLHLPTRPTILRAMAEAKRRDQAKQQQTPSVTPSPLKAVRVLARAVARVKTPLGEGAGVIRRGRAPLRGGRAPSAPMRKVTKRMTTKHRMMQVRVGI
jgi:hypothetical protein